MSATQFDKIQELAQKQQDLKIKVSKSDKAPQIGEIRFLENIKYDEEEKDVVPEIYREHRHKFSTKPTDLAAYKR